MTSTSTSDASAASKPNAPGPHWPAGLSVAVLGERLRPATLGFSIAVMACVYLGRRMPVGAPRVRR